MTDEERNLHYRKLRKWRLIFIISVWIIAGMIWLISRLLENWNGTQSSKINKTNLEWLIKNPTTFDYYDFQTVAPLQSGKILHDYGRPIAKIFQVKDNELGFIFSKKNLPSSPGPNTFYQNLFDNKNERIDTVFLKKDELIRTLSNDTLKIFLKDTTFYIIEVIKIERLNCPLFVSFMKQGNKHSFDNYRMAGTITNIESIRGNAEIIQELPFSVGENENTRIDFIIKTKNGNAEFLIKGTSPLSQLWVNRVLVKNDKIWVLQE